MTTDKLLAEQKTLRLRIKRRREQNNADEIRLNEIGHQLERLRLAELVGVPDGVRVRYRRPPHESNAWINDALGTLRKVNRTRAVVDYGSRGRWTLPVEWLASAATEQGYMVSL